MFTGIITDIGEIVSLSSTIVQEMAHQAQIQFVSEIDEALPRLVGDSAKLTQILVNLSAHGRVR